MFAQLPGLSFGCGPASAGRSPEDVCSSLTQDGVKVAAVSGRLAHSGQGEGGVQMQGEPAAAEASVMLHQHEAHSAFSQEVVPGSQDPGSGGLHRLPGVEVWIVTCACTQALASHAHLWCPR